MMKSYTNLQYFLTVLILCLMNLGYNAQILELYEGTITFLIYIYII